MFTFHIYYGGHRKSILSSCHLHIVGTCLWHVKLASSKLRYAYCNMPQACPYNLAFFITLLFWHDYKVRQKFGNDIMAQCLVITFIAFSRASTRVSPEAFIAASLRAPVAFLAKGSGILSMAAIALSIASRTSVSAAGFTIFT